MADTQNQKNKIETVWTETTDKGIVVKVNKKTLPARDDKPERVTFSVNLGRERAEGGGTIPLFLRKGENADRMVIGLELTVARALEEGERLFIESLPKREPQERRPRNGRNRHEPSPEAWKKRGTHWKGG
jgi:hypothetical protein